ncbi:MAG: hypothetical protein B7X81_02945 [Hydrogenophilales bacterium 17-61-76]|nr:MAG: hypothetical protein B7X81_02945 [Hydrogenophilales bacterium 17-61-76]
MPLGKFNTGAIRRGSFGGRCGLDRFSKLLGISLIVNTPIRDMRFVENPGDITRMFISVLEVGRIGYATRPWQFGIRIGSRRMLDKRMFDK